MATNLGSSDDNSMISGINVTPMVDIVLVLLVIFMITAPVIYQSAIKVQLPKAASGGNSKKSSFQFTITKSGEIFWNGKMKNWAQLESELTNIPDSQKLESVSISADEKSYHGQVIHLMDVLQKAGLKRFALNVENRK